jgi:hypothetical protein
MKIVTALLLILLIIWPCNTCLSNGATTKDKELFFESGQVRTTITVTSLPASQPCKAAASWIWGAENTCPDTVVGALEVKVAGEPIFVPLSAFADLGNPRSVRIESRKGKGRFAIILTGGDAATSYSATLEFRDNLLSERVVRSGEFPDQAWGKTLYKFNTDN